MRVKIVQEHSSQDDSDSDDEETRMWSNPDAPSRQEIQRVKVNYRYPGRRGKAVKPCKDRWHSQHEIESAVDAMQHYH
jgi:hypothetical protein